jgi:ADP-heptose:LPS heptosyltransferase
MWPLNHWVAVGRELAGRGFRVALPRGSAGERAEAEQIAAQVPGSSVLPKMSVTEIARMIDACALVVGTDTGFVHLAHALQKRTVMIFVARRRRIAASNRPTVRSRSVTAVRRRRSAPHSTRSTTCIRFCKCEQA